MIIEDGRSAISVANENWVHENKISKFRKAYAIDPEGAITVESKVDPEYLTEEHKEIDWLKRCITEFEQETNFSGKISVYFEKNRR